MRKRERQYVGVQCNFWACGPLQALRNDHNGCMGVTVVPESCPFLFERSFAINVCNNVRCWLPVRNTQPDSNYTSCQSCGLFQLVVLCCSALLCSPAPFPPHTVARQLSTNFKTQARPRPWPSTRHPS